MDDIVAQCPGVLAIHNNVFIYGKDNKDHDSKIINLFNIAQKEGLICNSAKCSIKQESVTLLGGMFSAKAYSPDPERSKSFLVAVNYLQTFVPPLKSPHLTHTSLPKKGKHLCLGWELQHKLPENKVPLWESLAEAPQILWEEQTSYSPVWCFTQGTGSLYHPRQSAHSFCKQISHRHRDMLCQHQEQTPSHHVWLWEVPHLPVHKDIYCHIPEMISLKNVISAPVRLQRMLLRLQQYDMVITYRPDKEMLLADTLSRFPSRTNTEIKQPKSWCHIHVSLHQEAADEGWGRDITGPHPIDSPQWPWMAGQTDVNVSPESPEITGTSIMNSPSRMTYSWKVNE